MPSAHGANISRTYEDALETIIGFIDASPAPVLVGIDGRSGSGKTTFAGRLAADLRPRVVETFEVEDFIGGWHGLTNDIAKVGAIASDIQETGQSAARAWDWYANSWTEPIRVPERASADVVFVVGCGSTSATVRPHLDVTVWIDVDEEARRRRVQDRDPYDWSEYWAVWASQEEKLLAECPSDQLADVIVRPDTSQARR